MRLSRADLLQGTLDLLILKTLALGPLHGWAISKRIQQLSKDILTVNQGSLYPALYRLEDRGWIAGAEGHPTKAGGSSCTGSQPPGGGSWRTNWRPGGPSLHAAIATLKPSLPLQVTTLPRLVDVSLAAERFRVRSSSAFCRTEP